MSKFFNVSFRKLPIALAALVLAIGLIALACSGGSSPTEPTTPGSGPASADTSGGLTGGEPTGGPDITVEKSTNGEDADQGPGPEIVVGDPVLWEYVVTNTGGVLLTNINLNDNKIGDIDCPKSALEAGGSMTCTAEGVAEKGQYRNVARVRGTAPDKTETADKDDSHYLGVEAGGKPRIRIEKSTNGEDADSPTGPEIAVGDPVVWTYEVTNTGDVTLSDIVVTDDQIGTITCPMTTLEPTESMTCTAEGVAEEGQYENEGRVVGTAPDKTQTGDKDRSHYLGILAGDPDIRIEKATNGEDADSPTGPVIAVGDPVVWTYEVTNTGDVTLSDIVVTDDQIGTITCPMTTLEPTESMTCTAEGFAEEGQYRNEGRVVGTAPDGGEVADKDRSHYLGEKEETGFEGCSHGYWKNHIGSWSPTGYLPGDIVEDVFSSAAAIPSVGNATLLEALNFGGGPGVEGAARNLLKQAVGSLLNAAHPDVAFPLTESAVIDMVNSALDTQNRQAILSLADDLDFDNNLGCPLN